MTASTSRRWHGLGAVCFLFLGGLASAAVPVHPLEDIRDRVRAYAEQALAGGDPRTRVEVGNLDPRLRLHQCKHALETFSPPGQRTAGRTTIGVRCTAPTPWTIYVSARISRYAEVYAVSRSLSRGSRLRAEDLRRIEVNVGSLAHGYFTEAEQLLGMELRRPTRPGEILTPSMLSAPRLVQRGQTVLVQAETGAARVTMQGTALEDGALGDRIRVRNPRSDRVIEGTVVGEGRVNVAL